ncbi:MAG: branched-chain amino acid ABC transporter permease [Candidatus Heimdallarchaeota archaeon]|nr:branched-chain amino acid ABC transporter permease [Candidatus Heimdallarchaeota archaeon]
MSKVVNKNDNTIIEADTDWIRIRRLIISTLFFALPAVLIIFDTKFDKDWGGLWIDKDLGVLPDLSWWVHGLYFGYLFVLIIALKNENDRTFNLEKIPALKNKVDEVKLVISLVAMLTITLLIFLYLDRDVNATETITSTGVRVVIVERIESGFINFRVLLVSLVFIASILIKLFGKEIGDKGSKYYKPTSAVLLVISFIYLLAPPFLIVGGMTLNFGADQFLFDIAHRTSLNFSQYQLLSILSYIFFIAVSSRDVSSFFKESTGNKILVFLIIFFIFAIDSIAITMNSTTSINFFSQIVLITVRAAQYILISAGLTLTTRVRKFSNFAQAEFLTIGLYTVVAFRTWNIFKNGDLPFVGDAFGNYSYMYSNIFFQIPAIFIITGFVGILGEIFIYAPLDRRKATALTLMVGSIGLSLIIRQTVQEIFGGSNQIATNPKYPAFFDNIHDTVKSISIGASIQIVEICFLIGIIIGAIIPYYKSQQIKKDIPIGVVTGAVSGFIIGNLLTLPFTSHPERGIIDEEREKIALGKFDFFWMRGEDSLRLFNVGEKTVLVDRDQAWTVFLMIIIVLILRFIFTRTTLGISMRATADDDELAQITGINTRRVVYWTWFIAAGVTGVGAVFLLSSSSFTPATAFDRYLLIIFAVVILGGFDSFEGTLVSAFIIAFVQSLTVLINFELFTWEKSSDHIDKLVFWNAIGDWFFVGPFAIMIVVLLVRPRGIFGLVDPKSKL